MSKINRLKLCNFCLMLAMVLILASSIQMEACGGKGWGNLSFATWMYLHCALGLLMFLMVVVHLYLHWGKNRWFKTFKALKSKPTKWLCIFFTITLFFSIAAFVVTIHQMAHSPLGAVHGKIGFVFLLICIGHTAKRWKWVKTQLFRFKNR